jgi:protein-disulfide isomerase
MSLSHAMDRLTGLIAVVAVCGTVYVLYGDKSSPASQAQSTISESQWKIANRGGHVIGPAASDLVIVEFADYECEFCETMRHTLDSLRALHPDVAIRYRHKPITRIHRFATDAAIAAECAAQQGRFTEYHSVLFDHQRQFGAIDWVTFGARTAGVDTLHLRECLERREPAAANIARDVEDASTLKVNGTPVVFIGRRRLSGAVPLETLLDAEKAARAERAKL